MQGKELVISKKRRRPLEASDQGSQSKKPWKPLPTAKDRDVSNSPERSRGKSSNSREFFKPNHLSNGIQFL